MDGYQGDLQRYGGSGGGTLKQSTPSTRTGKGGRHERTNQNIQCFPEEKNHCGTPGDLLDRGSLSACRDFGRRIFQERILAVCSNSWRRCTIFRGGPEHAGQVIYRPSRTAKTIGFSEVWLVSSRLLSRLFVGARLLYHEIPVEDVRTPSQWDGERVAP